VKTRFSANVSGSMLRIAAWTFSGSSVAWLKTLIVTYAMGVLEDKGVTAECYGGFTF
jgi:hypothetical protein